MAATYQWGEDTGDATGTPLKGTTRTLGVTDVNWKSSGVQGTAYTAAPITAGDVSFPKFQFGKFSGSFNQLLNGFFAHTAGTLSTDYFTLYGPPSASSSLITYATPSNASVVSGLVDFTAVVAITSGSVVYFGDTGPEAAGKVASYSRSGSEDVFTNYLVTQLDTDTDAPAGDTATVTLTIQYDEN